MEIFLWGHVEDDSVDKFHAASAEGFEFGNLTIVVIGESMELGFFNLSSCCLTGSWKFGERHGIDYTVPSVW